MLATGAISCAHWLADLLDIEVSTAREKVRVARALRTLPATRAQFDAGSLSYAKVRHLTRVATADNEVELLAMAERHAAGRLVQVLAHWQQREEPEAATRRRRDERGVSFRTAPSGSRVITIELPPELSAVVEATIDQAVMSAPAGSTDASATLRHQRADAFVRLVRAMVLSA